MLSAERKAEILKDLSDALEQDLPVALIILDGNSVSLDTSLTEEEFHDLIEEMSERRDELSDAEGVFEDSIPERLH